MLDHMTFRVSDLAKSNSFYAAALAPLGYRVMREFSFNGQTMFGMGIDSADGPKIDTWFIAGPSEYGESVTRGCHLCWRAPNRAAVDAFYAAAMANGAKDNGEPGVRAHYHPNYYGAFVIDLDGNNVEAVCHAPQ
ncbi:MAG: VOC family protein [Burkholderiales bacterium]|nr:MAG: VOC family protein [Betaproteobacteria bacterium]TAG28894.1 MAG: VOC family protein [Burkholderiales bacterium]